MGDISGLGALTEKDRARFTELQKMAFENAQVISALEKQKAEEIETINRNSMVAQIADVEKSAIGTIRHCLRNIRWTNWKAS